MYHYNKMGTEKTRSVEIKDVFLENKYNTFIKYCEKKNFIYMNELYNFDFDLLLKEIGFGKVKVCDIKDKFNKYICENNVELYLVDIKNKYHKIDIDNLNLYKIKDTSILKLKTQYNSLYELIEGIKNINSYRGISKEEFLLIRKICNLIEESICRIHTGEKILIKEFYKLCPLSKTFVQICEKLGYTYMSQLNSFDFEKSLSSLYGFGKTKMNNIKQLHNLYNELYDNYKLEQYEDGDINSLKINLAFYESHFNSFIYYCFINNFRYMGDLQDFELNTLYDVIGFGEVKIERIKRRYYSVYELHSNEESNIYEEIYSIEINDFYKNVSIDFTDMYDINSNSQGILKEELIDIDDLIDDKNHDFVVLKQINYIELKNIKNMLLDMQQDPSYLIQSIFKKIKSQGNYEILKMRAEGLSLESIGKMKSVSKERIRQIEKKIISKIEKYMYGINLLINKDKIDKSKDLILEEESRIIYEYIMKKKECKKEQVIVKSNIEDLNINNDDIKNEDKKCEIKNEADNIEDDVNSKTNKVKELLHEKRILSNKEIADACRQVGCSTTELYKIFDEVIVDFDEIENNKYQRKNNTYILI
ncbi:hypothetical protein TPELB_20080 [Terrisporobacter petrolearius]|uniref:RNA polymerase sigma-70 region 4 domain-containing protein n=1 Tax=Terrisporobacter petrolearius TaxID=1460447 RepID=A0ABZ3FGI2_9FIRM